MKRLLIKWHSKLVPFSIALALVLAVPGALALAEDGGGREPSGRDQAERRQDQHQVVATPATQDDHGQQNQNSDNSGSKKEDDDDHGKNQNEQTGYGEREDEHENEAEHGGGQAILSISSINFSSVASTSASISWLTNLPTTGNVMFGTTTQLATNGGTVIIDPTATTTTHSLALTGLIPSTTYYLTVRASSADKTATSSVVSFTTTATGTSTPPVISPPPAILFTSAFNVSSTSAIVILVTDQLADGKLWLSTTTPVSTAGTPAASDVVPAFFHLGTLSGLIPNTTYYYVVTSTNAGGGTATSTTYSFTTPAM
ncbi:MAG: fibronectin type III domain-containing protein [Candidatus Paceibacterota bacterium]|jgi:hypothetical protein